MNQKPLHGIIGYLIKEEFGNDPELIIVMNSSCQESQEVDNNTIPLFENLRKDDRTEFCNVDLIIMKYGQVRVIMEIEETEISPTEVYGKFMTSAMSRYHVRDTRGHFDIDESTLFIQIVGVSKTEHDKTILLSQYENIESSIGKMLREWRIPIKSYKLIAGNENEFNPGGAARMDLVKAIIKAVSEKEALQRSASKYSQLNKEELWQLLFESISRKCKLTRFENAESIGIPDVNIGYHRYDFWLELKKEEKGYCRVNQNQLEWQYHRIKSYCQNSFYLISMEWGNICLYAARDLLKKDTVISEGNEVKLLLSNQKPIYIFYSHDWMQFILESLHQHVFFVNSF